MFGKLNRRVEPRQKVLPNSAFKGETGRMLKHMGIKKNGPENFVPTQADYQKKLNDLQVKEEAFIAKINTQLGDDIQVSPWAMIPFPCWTKGPHGDFLYKIVDLFPFGPWNLLLLPDDDRSGLILDMDKNPKTVSQQQIEICNNFIGQARDSVANAKIETERGIARMDMDAPQRFAQSRMRAQTAIMTLAFQLGKEIIGEKSFVKSRELFFGDGELARLA